MGVEMTHLANLFLMKMFLYPIFQFFMPKSVSCLRCYSTDLKSLSLATFSPHHLKRFSGFPFPKVLPVPNPIPSLHYSTTRSDLY